MDRSEERARMEKRVTAVETDRIRRSLTVAWTMDRSTCSSSEVAAPKMDRTAEGDHAGDGSRYREVAIPMGRETSGRTNDGSQRRRVAPTMVASEINHSRDRSTSRTGNRFPQLYDPDISTQIYSRSCRRVGAILNQYDLAPHSWVRSALHADPAQKLSQR